MLEIYDFYADWCGPCKMIAPMIKEMENQNPEITLKKIDVDTGQELSAQYGVKSIPTLVILKDGVEVDRVIGFTTQDNLLKRIKRIS